MKPFKKLVAITGTYTNREGQEKNRYQRVGTLFKRDDDSLVAKYECIPIGWDGWANAYDLDEDRQQNNQAGMKKARAAAAPEPELDDDIPF